MSRELARHHASPVTYRAVRAHCPWERGTNQNTNGLLRQFFPTGTRFHQLSRTHIKQVQAMFNDRPRKVLNWHSPAHAFRQLLH